MIVLDPPLLARIRKEPCAHCYKPGPSEASHTFAKGIGGAQLDVVENILPLCRECHQAHHDGKKSPRTKHHLGTYALICTTAVRLNRTADDIEATLFAYRNAPKECSYKVGADGRKSPLCPGRDIVDFVPPRPSVAGPSDRLASVESVQDRGWEDF